MELYYNDVKISSVNILPLHTVGQVKQTLYLWSIKNKVLHYDVKMFFGDGSQLAPVVFNTNMYDMCNFESKAEFLDGQVYVSKKCDGIVKIKGNPAHRTKIQTKQIQAKHIQIKVVKTKPTQPTKPTGLTEQQKKEMILKRLQQFDTQQFEPRTPQNINLLDSPTVQTLPPIPATILDISLLNVPLRDHQTKVIEHMLTYRGLIAVHSIGSGKTLIAATSAITVLNYDPKLRIIFISPKSLLDNFRQTLHKFYDHVDWERFSFYTYEKFQIDYNNGLIDCYNTYLIIDEAHRLRTSFNPHKLDSAKTVRVVLRAARKACKVLLLTATPVVNEPYDISNLISIVRGELTPMTKRSFYRTIYSKKGQPLLGFDDFFKDCLSVYVRPQDNTYPEVKIHITEIPMSSKYTEEYNRVETQLLHPLQKDVLGENDLKPFHNGIRRAVNADIEEFNPKLDWVRAHLLKYNNRKMVIFSPFISLGIRQLERLVVDFDIKPKFGIITGDNTESERQKVIKEYNEDQIQILLISVGAGGLGINLIGTRDVVIMQPGWNDVEMEQAMGRAIRFHSHTHLPPNEQKVEVWKLLLVKPDYTVHNELAADQIIERITQRKKMIIDPFLSQIVPIDQ